MRRDNIAHGRRFSENFFQWRFVRQDAERRSFLRVDRVHGGQQLTQSLGALVLFHPAPVDMISWCAGQQLISHERTWEERSGLAEISGDGDADQEAVAVSRMDEGVV